MVTVSNQKKEECAEEGRGGIRKWLPFDSDLLKVSAELAI